jgi:hypothetical protein
MKTITLTAVILILLSGFVSHGQSSGLILTKEQNKIWCDNLKSLTLTDQLDYIKKRILKDTIVFNSEQIRRDLIVLDKEGLENQNREEILKVNGFIAENRIFYLLKYQYKRSKKYGLSGFSWNNWTKNSDIIRFHDFLTLDKIQGIEVIIDDNNDMGIKITGSSFGFIIFNLNKEKYIREFNKKFK